LVYDHDPHPHELRQDPGEYHNFADVFSKSRASVLDDHCPYDLKITLKDGTTPPLGPIYSLSQEELLALCKFIDENVSMGFMTPTLSSWHTYPLHLEEGQIPPPLLWLSGNQPGLKEGPVPAPIDK